MALTQVSTGGIKDGQVHTADLADAQITAGKLHADALDHTYTLGASGTDHYTFTGEGLTGAVNDPTLYLTRGKTYRFVNGNSSGAHPFRIQSVAGAGGTEYNTGVTNNAGAGGSTIIFEVPHDAPDVLYYICTSHASMNGIFYVTGALADGTVTTAKLADDAVTDAKLANSINTAIAANTAKNTNATHTGDVTGSGSLTIANNAVTTAKISDEAVTLAKLPHGDGSSDGKFLRANNGADPTFESLPSSGATLSGSTNNTVVTVTGANAMQGESNVTIDSSGRLLIGTTTEGHAAGDELTVANTGHAGITIRSGTTSRGALYFSDGTSGSDEYRGAVNYDHTDNYLRFYTNGSEKLRIQSGGGISFNGDTAAANALNDYEEGSWTPAPENLSNSPTYYNLVGKYTKVGRLVTIWGMIQVGATQPTFSSNTLDLRIAGLPFANDDTTGYIGGAGATTYQSFNVYGSTYNNYGAEGNVVCGTANSTRIIFNVNPHQNNGIRGTVRRKALEGTGPILTWTMQYQTTA